MRPEPGNVRWRAFLFLIVAKETLSCPRLKHPCAKSICRISGQTPASSAGHSLAITRFPHVIGRQTDCDSRFGSPWVSRRHCRYYLTGDDVWLEDLGSRSGTLLNGEHLQYPRPVKDGDRFELAGMAFQVRLPGAPATLALSAHENRQATPHELRQQQVLVVEDNSDAAATLAMLLRRWGHEVAVAHNGPEAISLAQATHPQTVLLDIRLPGMDGYEVAKRLRTQAGLQDARLVALTGYRDEEDVLRSQDAGLDALLTKPVPPDALRELIECPMDKACKEFLKALKQAEGQSVQEIGRGLRLLPAGTTAEDVYERCQQRGWIMGAAAGPWLTPEGIKPPRPQTWMAAT
jgi:CheY-like chemotaxis protein